MQTGIALPKDRIWTEQLFSYLPFDRDLVHQMALRFTFLILLWLSGLLAYSFDGLMEEFISNIQIYPAFWAPASSSHSAYT